MLELADLSRRYGETLALAGLSLQAEEGRLLGFVGPNGAGKTTAMRIALALGLLQLALTAVVGLAAASASGAIELDTGDIGTLAVVLVWFLFGYLLWSSLYAMGGVMVSRQEDLQSSTTVLTVLLVIGYLLAFPSIDDPDGGLAVVSSLVPLFSPIIMPLRVALGEASALEIAASLGLLIVAIAVLIPLGARIYERSVLRMGKPMKLREAWRAARA